MRPFLFASWIAAHLVVVSVVAAEPVRHGATGQAAVAGKPRVPVVTIKPKKGAARHLATRKAGEPGQPDPSVRRAIAGAPAPPARTVRESPELRAMRELDLALFPSVTPTSGAPWTVEATPLVDRGEPRLVSSLPPATLLPAAPAEPGRDLSWLRALTMPDIPMRWDARVIRYLEFYKTPRGRSMVAAWLRKSGRYGASIRRFLSEQGLPEDILWLALVESGFDPAIQSPAGAAGLWQFMPEGARIYGLTVDRWVDERLDPERSTVAAARYLADLRQRFGGWELAFAAYNMGYRGLLSSIRKYNTNDFWELSRVESGMPLETALYVPKILAMAIVARNRPAFGLEDVELDPAIAFDKVAVGSGVSIESLALAAGTSPEKVSELNPQILAGRVPPAAPASTGTTWAVRIPAGSAAKVATALPKFALAEAKLDRYVVRWGESIDDIAARRGTTRGVLARLNGLRRDEALRPGTVVFVPAPVLADGRYDPYADLPAQMPTVVVPAERFSYPDRRRVFYRVMPGDTLRSIAWLFGATGDELCRWNAIDPTAQLQDGMTLQVFVTKTPPRADTLVLEEKDAHVLEVGSPNFFAHFEAQRGRTRLAIIARAGDTWRSIGHRYDLTVAQLERINGRARTTPLAAGDKLIVYVPTGKAEAVKKGDDSGALKAAELKEVAVARPGVGDAILAGDDAGRALFSSSTTLTNGAFMSASAQEAHRRP